MSWVAVVLKYWRAGGIVMLTLSLGFYIWLAGERGEERDRLETELKKTKATIVLMNEAAQEREERHEFSKEQNRLFRRAENSAVSFDDALRAAYDSLRQRQSDYGR
jgi:hypothetical protein